MRLPSLRRHRCPDLNPGEVRAAAIALNSGDQGPADRIVATAPEECRQHVALALLAASVEE